MLCVKLEFLVILVASKNYIIATIKSCMEIIVALVVLPGLSKSREDTLEIDWQALHWFRGN